MAPRPQRIAVVSDAVQPWNTGGKERRQHELLSRLAREGFVVDVYTMKWWTGPRTIELEGITFHAICPKLPLYRGGRRSVLQAVVFALATLRLVTRRFDVLEVDAIPFLQLYPARLVAGVRRRPMIVTWHEFWGRAYWIDYLGPAGRLAALVERTAIALPDRIVAASQGTADRIVAAAGGADVRVVANGVSFHELEEVVAGVATPTGDPAELLCVGRLLSHKKVDAAIGAMRVLVDQGVHARLTIVGEGPEATRLRALVSELGLDEVVAMRSFLPEHADVLRAIAAADVLVFPSIREGFGMVAMEAMAVGTPVVTSDHPDNLARDLVQTGVNGETCAPEPQALAAAIARVLADRPRLSAGALQTARGYDWDTLAHDAASVYVA